MDLKFLIIVRSTDKYFAAHEQQARLRAIQHLKEVAIVELAIEFISGGGAYVIRTESTVRLAVLLQTNRLFQGESREVLPVAEASDYLTEMIRQVEGNSLLH